MSCSDIITDVNVRLDAQWQKGLSGTWTYSTDCYVHPQVITSSFVTNDHISMLITVIRDLLSQQTFRDKSTQGLIQKHRDLVPACDVLHKFSAWNPDLVKLCDISASDLLRDLISDSLRIHSARDVNAVSIVQFSLLTMISLGIFDDFSCQMVLKQWITKSSAKHVKVCDLASSLINRDLIDPIIPPQPSKRSMMKFIDKIDSRVAIKVPYVPIILTDDQIKQKRKKRNRAINFSRGY